MSKAKNFFQIIRFRRQEEIGKALHFACDYIAEDCNRCPFHETENCAEQCLPPAALKDKASACSDLLYLHFWGKAKIHSVFNPELPRNYGDVGKNHD